MGSGLLDYYRRPYKVFDAMKGVYTRVLISLERDAAPYVMRSAAPVSSAACSIARGCAR